MDLLSLVGLPDWLPRFTGSGARRGKQRLHAVVDKIVDAYGAGEGDSDALVTALFSASDAPGTTFSKRDVRNEAMVLFLAGYETTATTLAWAWYLISQSPRVKSRLHEELSQVLGGSEPVLQDVRRLPYTRAIIEETLRLYPPIPIIGREALEDGTIGTGPFKKGDLLLTVPYLTHRKPQLWSKPHHFIPERFDARFSERPEKYSYFPFAAGPRTCPGQVFGITEAVLTLATLAQRFDLSLEPGQEVVPQCRLTIRPGDELPMRIHHR